MYIYLYIHTRLGFLNTKMHQLPHSHTHLQTCVRMQIAYHNYVAEVIRCICSTCVLLKEGHNNQTKNLD